MALLPLRLNLQQRRDQIAVRTFTTPSVPGTMSFTHPDISQPFSAAILIFSYDDADDSDLSHAILGVGMLASNGDTTPNKNNSLCLYGDNSNRSAPANFTFHDGADGATFCVNPQWPTGNEIIATYEGVDLPRGFQLNFTSTASQCKVTVVFFAGLESAAVGFDTGSTLNAEQVGASGEVFEPDLLITLTADGTINVVNDDAALNLGFAINDSPIQQASAYVNWERFTEPTNAGGFVSTDRSGLAFRGGSRTATAINVESFSPTGFNWSAPATSSFGYLALKFSGAVRLACASMPVSGSSGSESFNAFGFAPDLVLGMSTLLTTANTDTSGTAAGGAGIFVTGIYGSRALTAHAEVGKTVTTPAAPFNLHTRQEDVAVLTYDHQGTVVQRGTWVGSSGSGFTLNWTTATAGYITALGIQLEQTPVVFDESVLISDGAVLLLSENLAGDEEAVAIADAGVLLDTDVAIVGPDAVNKRRGASTQGGGLKGSTWGGGPERGLTA